MEILLRRRLSADGCTLGDLFIDGHFECMTLEDIVRDGPKVAHETAIPAGRYQVLITRSKRFRRLLPILCDVPGFEGIRIHAGNVAADTSGCILVGSGRQSGTLGGSRSALSALQSQMAKALAKGDEVWITIEPAGTLDRVLA